MLIDGRSRPAFVDPDVRLLFCFVALTVRIPDVRARLFFPGKTDYMLSRM